jgi:hypothetical protein
VSEQTTIATSADLTARLSTQVYTRLFAKNGGSTVDTVLRDLCIDEANSLFRTMTRVAFAQGVYSTTDTIDPAIVGCVVDLACEIAARRHGLWDEQGSFAEQGRKARELIKQLNRDADARAPGSSQSPPLPRAQTLNVQTSVGRETNVWNRIADYKDTGGF